MEDFSSGIKVLGFKIDRNNNSNIQIINQNDKAYSKFMKARETSREKQQKKSGEFGSDASV